MKKIAVLAALLAVFVGCKTQSKKTEQTKLCSTVAKLCFCTVSKQVLVKKYCKKRKNVVE